MGSKALAMTRATHVGVPALWCPTGCSKSFSHVHRLPAELKSSQLPGNQPEHLQTTFPQQAIIKFKVVGLRDEGRQLSKSGAIVLAAFYAGPRHVGRTWADQAQHALRYPTVMISMPIWGERGPFRTETGDSGALEERNGGIRERPPNNPKNSVPKTWDLFTGAGFQTAHENVGESGRDKS